MVNLSHTYHLAIARRSSLQTILLLRLGTPDQPYVHGILQRKQSCSNIFSLPRFATPWFDGRCFEWKLNQLKTAPKCGENAGRILHWLNEKAIFYEKNWKDVPSPRGYQRTKRTLCCGIFLHSVVLVFLYLTSSHQKDMSWSLSWSTVVLYVPPEDSFSKQGFYCVPIVW